MRKNDSFLPILFRGKFKIFRKKKIIKVLFKEKRLCSVATEPICKTYTIGHQVWLTSASTSNPVSQIHTTL